MTTARLALLFAICFLVGAIAAVVGRAALHRPYAGDEPGAAAADHRGHAAPVAPAPAPAPAPTPAADGHDHGAVIAPAPAPTPASTPGPATAIGNTVCPGCGMDVDADLAPVETAHGAIAIACTPCIARIRREPGRHAEAARANRKAP